MNKEEEKGLQFPNVLLALGHSGTVDTEHYPYDLGTQRSRSSGLFSAVRAAFAKATPIEGKEHDELDGAIRQIVSKAIAADGVIDIYSTVGLKSPDISILSDQFLDEMRGLPAAA